MHCTCSCTDDLCVRSMHPYVFQTYGVGYERKRRLYPGGDRVL